MTVQEWLGADNQLGIDIWKNKYQHENETFDEWLDRVSAGNQHVRQLIVEKKFLFGGRILASRGLDKIGKKITLSNCYVVAPPEDNIESIFECASKLARTYSYGGGCGVDISKLSPRGAKINNAAKETSGSVSFMELYNLTTALIGQNGRRGAMMISLSCDHPDLEEFIDLKSDLDKMTKANISVRINDNFMRAALNHQMYDLEFVREETGEVIKKTVDAAAVFRRLCEMNWDYAEPGILFWDRINNWNLLSEDDNFSYAGTNPCAEEPLPAGGSCLLGSMNLSEFVSEDKLFMAEEFREAVHTAVLALNDVLDEGQPLHPLQEQRDSVRDWRQIGLGIFGLADMLIKMEIPYGSDQAVRLCDNIGLWMADTAIRASAVLASWDGPYPNYNEEAVRKSEFFWKNTLPVSGSRELVEKHGLRNSQLLTIAPTGSLSTMLGVSGGIEPIFANYYTRKTESLHGHEEYYKVYTPIVKAYMDEHGITDDADLPEWFVTARDLNFVDRIEMQGVWQTHIDASISSTVNVPESFTVDDVVDLYTFAWSRGLKGVTIFRDNCKRLGVLTTNAPKREETITYEGSTIDGSTIQSGLKRGDIIKPSDSFIGKKRTLHTGCGTLHCEAFFDPETFQLREVYLSKGSTGGCNNFMIGLSRMISIAARGGIDIYDIVDQLRSAGTCPSYAVRKATKGDVSKGSSCPVAVGNALIEMYEEMLTNCINDIPWHRASVITPEVIIKPLCPECGEELIFEGGCNTCKNCGYSKCD